MDPQSLNVLGPKQLVGSKTNKIVSGGVGEVEGVEGEHLDVLSLDLSDEDLLHLAKQWEGKYHGYEGKIKHRQVRNKQYYLGNQEQGSNLATDGIPIAGNLLFEAEETFLPAALSKNPEPVVYADNTDEGNKLANAVKTMLQYHADQLILRRKLAMMTRQWSIYFLGVLKHGWDDEIKDIKTEVRRIQDFVFDVDGYVDVYGDFVGYMGERITVSAEKLIEEFPKHKAYITVMVDGKLGTSVTYTEWWNDDYCFYTFKDKVLDKHKNQYFNYDKTEKQTDEFGVEQEVTIPAQNHFAKAKKPYTFLSVFSLGDQPHDITGLIEQNIPNQNLLSREIQQADYNVSRANNSRAYSAQNFNQETAKQAAVAQQKGHPVIIPAGRPIHEAIVDFPAQSLPDAHFKMIEMNATNIKSIFGTEGLTSAPPNEDTTARGMILNQQFDNTRIGGGIGDALEQVADNVFNWWVQLYQVYYDQPHYAAILGQGKAVEYITLSNQDLNRWLIISVSPDSMKPHDEITEMNQAMTLWQEGALDPKTLLTVLNFPDPQGTAEQVMLFKTNPQMYIQLNFPELAQQLQAAAMQQMQEQQAMAAQQQQSAAVQNQQQGQQDVKMAGAKAEAVARGKAAGTPPVANSPAPELSTPLASPNLQQVGLPKV